MTVAMEAAMKVCDRHGVGKTRLSSVDVLDVFAGTKDELEAVGRVLRHASDYLYLHLEPCRPSCDSAAVDLLDDLRAGLGVL